MPQTHDFLPGNFDLVAVYLPFTLIDTTDVDSRVSFVPAKFQAKDKVPWLAILPNEPVAFYRGSRAPYSSLSHLPGPWFAAPTLEVFAVEDRAKSLLSLKCDRKEGERECE